MARSDRSHAAVESSAVHLDTLIALRERSFRNETGLFLAEGLRFAVAAIEAGALVRALVVCPDLLHSCNAYRVIRHLRATVPTVDVTNDQFVLLSTAETPSGIALLLEQRWHRLIEQRPRPNDVWLAVDNIRNPGNLGTILRTADATGAQGIMLIGGETDPYHPTCVRATMGAVFRQKLIRASAKSLAGWKARVGCTVIGASPGGSLDFRSADYRGPVVLMMGSERQGLRERQISLCDRLVRIPMVGPADSLNLAVATGLMLYQAFSQRHPPGR
jgi:RNA methyltransferase, TrmH family